MSAKTLRERAEKFRNGGLTWVKGTPMAAGTACLLFTRISSGYLDIVSDDDWDAMHELMRSRGVAGSDTLVNWNDDEARTVDEVIEVLEDAARLVEQREAE